MAGSGNCAMRNKLLYLTVPGLNVFIQILRKCWTDLSIQLHRGRMFNGLAGSPRPLNKGLNTSKAAMACQILAWCGGPAGVQEHSFHVSSKILTSLP